MKAILHRIRTVSRIIATTFMVWLVLDQSIRIFDIASVLPDHFDEQNFQRKAAPYIEFKGAPGKLDHDRYGYRWVPDTVDSNAVKIAFFGGSTGYQGEPPVASLLETMLNSSGNNRVQVANFSVVSSNHRQHLHNIIESRSLFKPDVVIFYGGYNETLQPAYYDPRPGYPYNYFYRHETPLFARLLLKYSPTFYLTDELLTRYGIGGLTPLAKLRNSGKPFSAQWNDAVISNYFDTIDLARSITGSFTSQHCTKPVFLFFYQPYQVPAEFMKAHNQIRKTIGTYSFGYDISDTFEKRGMDVFTDIVHVSQPGREAIAEEITRHLEANEEFNRCPGQT
jgi:hypothetical protein